jgi:hypothetical protein
MNIIDTEDMIKGLPDAALQKEAQNPSGQAPQFLVVSEIKRRKDMRERYAQNQQSQGTVKDQLLGMAPPAPQPQMASMGQPQGRPMPPMGGQMPMGQPPMQQPAPPMGMYGGGVVRMAEGLTVPQTREEQLAFLAGKSPEEILATAAQLGLNPNVLLGAGILNESQLEATMQQPSEEAAMAGYDSLINPVSIPAVASTNPLDVFAAPSRGQGVGPLPGFGGLPQEDITPVVQQQAAPQGLEQVIAAKAANTGTNGVGMSGAGGQMKAAFEAPQVQAPPQRDPYTPMQGDLIKMFQPPATPEETRDPYTPMQGDLIKMLQPQDQTTPALTGTSGVGMSGVGADMKRLVEAQERSALTGANGVGMSGVGADIKAGMGQQDATPVVSTSEMSLLDRVLGRATPAPLSDEQREANRRRVATAAVSSQSKSPYSPSRSDTSAKDFAPFEENRKAAYEEMLDRMEQSGVSMDTFALTNPAIRGYAEEFGIPLSAEEKKRMEDVLAFNPSSMEGLIDTSQRQLDVIQNPSSAAKADANRLDPSKLDEDTINAALNAKINPYSTAYNVNVGTNSASDRGDNDRQGETSTDKSVQGSLDDITDRTEGEESSGYKIPQSLTDLQKRGRALGQTLISGREEESKLEAQMKDLIEKRTRPTLSYADLIRESEQSMATQLADIKNEKGTQALIALGAGIASGDLGKGLSDAGKAVATSNAQKRALEARQQAVRMGFRKSEVDAVYQNQIAKENDKLEGMKFSLESLRRANAATQENERIILNFDTDLQKTIATLEQSERFKRADRATQDALNRRAALDFVTDRMSKMQLLTKSQEEQTAISNDLLAQASTALGIEIKTVSGAGSTTSTASPATTTIGGYSVTQKQ